MKAYIILLRCFYQAGKGGFKIAHMHFSNWTKRFFLLQGSDILIGALHFLSLRPMNQEKRIALFRKWAIRFQKNKLHFFQKGQFVFLQTLIKWQEFPLLLLAKVHKSVGFGTHDVDFCTLDKAASVQIYNSRSANANPFMNFRQ